MKSLLCFIISSICTILPIEIKNGCRNIGVTHNFMHFLKFKFQLNFKEVSIKIVAILCYNFVKV